MVFKKIKSYAKINLALNVVGKNPLLHKIESIVAFVSLYDEILIKKIKSKNHKISFYGKFSSNIKKKNTISKLLEILEKREILKNKKFQIKINKMIPPKSGLGGGSMNAASILGYFIKKKEIKISYKELNKICKLIGSYVILGIKQSNCIMNLENKIKYFHNYRKLNTLIIKPNFGCSTKDIYSKVRRFDRAKFQKPNKKMFNLDFLIKMNNSLESIAFSKYPKLKSIKFYLQNSLNPVFVRMTGSGSALVAYYKSKQRCENDIKKFSKKYKNYWCIASKTI